MNVKKKHLLYSSGKNLINTFVLQMYFVSFILIKLFKQQRNTNFQ